MKDSLRSQFDFTSTRNWVEAFSRFDGISFIKSFEQKGEKFWQREGQQRTLTIFHEAARRVPAYRDFLKHNKIKPELIKTIKDFEKVPPTDKWNYVTAYPLDKRIWDGNMNTVDLMAVSSGTSGEPTFWPRGGFQEFEAAVVHELLYRSTFEIHKYKTLLIIGFPMGIYVSGMATTLPTWLVSQKKEYNLVVITPGNDKAGVLRAVRSLGAQYDQVVLVGHPFFIKDVIESGAAMGVKWNTMRIRMMFCSEGFSERWREYVVKKVQKQFDPNIAVSTYGSSELLLMAYETPLSISARRILEQSKDLRVHLFDETMLPNLFQYNPFLRYIESVEKELIFTVASGIPLVRFNLHDSGQILSFKEVIDTLKMKKETNVWQLPFVAMWGRSDQTIVFYAANIYPEHIKAALDEKEFLRKLTGKFVMRKGMLKNMDEFLEVNIELVKGMKTSKDLMQKIQNIVINHLEKVNMEYLFLRNHLEKNLRPKITLWPYQDAKYFKPGLKPRYISQETR